MLIKNNGLPYQHDNASSEREKTLWIKPNENNTLYYEIVLLKDRGFKNSNALFYNLILKKTDKTRNNKKY